MSSKASRCAESPFATVADQARGADSGCPSQTSNDESWRAPGLTAVVEGAARHCIHEQQTRLLKLCFPVTVPSDGHAVLLHGQAGSITVASVGRELRAPCASGTRPASQLRGITRLLPVTLARFSTPLLCNRCLLARIAVRCHRCSVGLCRCHLPEEDTPS